MELNRRQFVDGLLAGTAALALVQAERIMSTYELAERLRDAGRLLDENEAPSDAMVYLDGQMLTPNSDYTVDRVSDYEVRLSLSDAPRSGSALTVIGDDWSACRVFA